MWTEEDLARIAEGLAWAAKTPPAETDLEDLLQRISAERGLEEGFVTDKGKRRRFTIDEYHRMAEAGILADYERLELIRGDIVEMAAVGDRHALCVMLAADLLSDLKPLGIVNPQNPLRLPEQGSIPQPDVVLLRRRPNFRSCAPNAEDVLLLVEVSDASLGYDRDFKVPIYAAAGILEAWLADLSSDTIFAYRRPSPEGYQEVRQYRRGDRISAHAFPDMRFRVVDLLG
jgi:Uma2 family endonuclease